jgi:DUF3014 family protein
VQDDGKKWIYWAIPALVVIGLGVALYYGRTQRQAPVTPAEHVEPAPPESVEPPIKHPVQEEPAPEPLPALEDSDSAVQQSVSGVFGGALDPFLIPQNIIRRVVVTIDNLPRKKTSVQLWPVKPTAGTLVTTADGEEAVLSAENYARYAPLVQIAQRADMEQVAAAYRRLYPLLQQAYVELGYPQGYFNDRLVEVIDHLLDTPEIAGPIKLTQPGVFYQYADASLEERSAGQKLLIRMGTGNAAIIKGKLRQLRAQVTRKDAQTP